MLSNNDIRILMRYVYRLAELSTDLSTNNGAILIDEDKWADRPLYADFALAEGFNAHLPGYENHPQAHERPFKYSVTEHAERAVIYDAAYKGVCTKGLTMIANWVACPDCARAIVLPGLKRVICHKACMDRTPERWAEMVDLGLSMCENNTANIVPIMQWEGEVGDVENLNNGKIWTP
jgi:deoxycytidylate deaminase